MHIYSKGLPKEMSKQKGFTLIELVIVVVILGLLAVTAIPKFIDLTEQAQQANIEGMAGGFATGVSLVRSQWEAEGRPQTGTNNTVSYDGTQLILTLENTTTTPQIRPGYVVGLTDGGGLGGGFGVENCIEIWENILQQPPTITSSLTTLNSATGDGINYFASKSGSSSTSLCHYYLKDTLNRDANGLYVDPANLVVGNSFTYQPANSSVLVLIE
ncbi:type II secretion system GspH family protein [Colwellia sp. D2M02]|uniref:MSHA fimbrial major subunit MshB n=2 Tax=Colwelliaceae TaxID=267889 RepID=A0ABN1L3B1_9GAMM|nr:type II secretion system GspH family protein [Colwellia sp. D2M02]